jgi:hypothetical protein
MVCLSFLPKTPNLAYPDLDSWCKIHVASGFDRHSLPMAVDDG